MSLTTANLSLSEEKLLYSTLSAEQLNNLGVKDLKPIVKAYGWKLSGTKPDLISRILAGPKPFQHDGTILDEIVKCWIMKPLKKTKGVKLGIKN